MDAISTILDAHVIGSDGDTVNKLLGAAAVVVDRHGEPSLQLVYSAPRSVC